MFYTFDPMGNVAQRYTSTGTLVSSDFYDSFGSATSTATPADPFGYEGKFGYYSEHGTSLILCGHRFYDSSAGRFINRDPIGYAGGINLYGYTGNNAVNAIDPSGFASCSGEEPTDPDNKNSGSNSSGSRTPDDGTGLNDWDADDPGSMIGPLIKIAFPPPAPPEPEVVPPSDPPGTTTFTGPSGSTISPDRLDHILNGEQLPNGWSGGHGMGRNTPDQSEFPFPDDDVEKYINDIVNDPNTQWRYDGDETGEARYKTTQPTGGVNTTVVFEPGGEGVITAWPNTPRNPY